MAFKTFPIEASHILMFARAIGDDNPIFTDSDYAAATPFGAVLAPPTFVQAGAQFDPDYPYRPKPNKPWFGSGKEPTGLKPISNNSERSRAVSELHAEQHYEYHRPLGAGDVLTATSRQGRSWEKQGRRGGNLLFRESTTEYRDQDGKLVVTARSVSVMTGRPPTVTEAK